MAALSQESGFYGASVDLGNVYDKEYPGSYTSAHQYYNRWDILNLSVKLRINFGGRLDKAERTMWVWVISKCTCNFLSSNQQMTVERNLLCQWWMNHSKSYVIDYYNSSMT